MKACNYLFPNPRIRTDLKETGISVRSCIESAQDRDYWNTPGNFIFEPTGTMSHAVSFIENNPTENRLLILLRREY